MNGFPFYLQRYSIQKINFLHSSIKKTNRRWYVRFSSRLWIALLIDSCFYLYINPSIFQSYPNPTRPSRLKLKYYEFAGRVVGKCIFESSCSAIRRLNVKARFMRSFLAQLIGLRVNYKVRLRPLPHSSFCWQKASAKTMRRDRRGYERRKCPGLLGTS